MDEISTQPSTQLMMDPRRLGEYDSDLSEEDQGDVLCILHPASPSAMAVASRIVESAPQHTISRAQMPIRVLGAVDDDQPIVQPDTMDLAQQGLVTRDLALRLSAELKDPLAGFTFGRNEQRCDFVFNYATTDGAKRISNIHFRIWLSEAGIIMLEDQSTNGTWVEGKHLRSKNRENNPPGRYRHTLTHGTLIKLQMVPGQDDDVQFVVRIPRREGPAEDLWDNNVAQYFQRLSLAREQRERSKVRQNGAPDLFANNQSNAVSLAVAASRSYIANRPREWSGGSKYNKGRAIGKGAFATVYLLTAKFTGEEFAAKEIEKRKFMKNGIVDIKVEQEMGIMKEISHANIVKFIETVDYADHLYIIMEYVPQGSLTSLIDDLGQLDEFHAKILTLQMLDALKYLHGKGIAHRDIKPDNVLVQSRPPNLVVKLTDFGLSKRIQPEEETFLRTFCGTILYCAPEVYKEYNTYFEGYPAEIRHKARVDKKAARYDHGVDIWSLAGLIFYSLTAAPPYEALPGMDHLAMLRKIMMDPLDIRPLQKKGVSEWGISFIKGMLVNMPSLRASIQDLLEHRWLTGIDPTISESIETADDTEVDVDGGCKRMPAEPFHLDTQMTDISDQEEDQADDTVGDIVGGGNGLGELGLEQSASQLSINAEDDDDKLDTPDEVDLVCDIPRPYSVGRIDIADSITSDSFVSFDQPFLQQQQQTGARPKGLFGEVNNVNSKTVPLRSITNTSTAINSRPRIPILRHDLRTLTMSENSLMDPSDGKDICGDDLDASLSMSSAPHPDDSLRFASTTSSLVAEPTGTFASSGALGGRATSLTGAESMVGGMAIGSPIVGSANVSINSFNRQTTTSTVNIPSASLRRVRPPDNDEDDGNERPAAKRHQSMVQNSENDGDNDNLDGSSEDIVPASAYFDMKDKSTHHLNYPKYTRQQYQGAVNLAASHGDSFMHGGKSFNMTINTWQRNTLSRSVSPEETGRAQSEPVGGNPAVITQAHCRAGSESRDGLPFNGQHGGWVNGIPTPEIAPFSPEFSNYYNAGGNPRILNIRQTSPEGRKFQPPRRILAKLVSMPDSVLPNITVTLTEMFTTWGRGFKNTIRFEPGHEDRIPKNALKLIMWAPDAKPGQEVPAEKENDYHFYIATKATHGIKVNNVPVKANQPSEPQTAPPTYWGRLHHGDIIIVWSHLRFKDRAVKFRFDCFWGASAKPRKAGDHFDVVAQGPERAALDRFCQWEESAFMRRKYEDDLKKEEERQTREVHAGGETVAIDADFAAVATVIGGSLVAGEGTSTVGPSTASSHADDGGRTAGGNVRLGQSFSA